MMSKTVFMIVLWGAVVWFYVGSILIWRFVIPELYLLFIKKKDIDKKAILAREQARRKAK